MEAVQKKASPWGRMVIIFVGLVAAFVVGYMSASRTPVENQPVTGSPTAQRWYCSMHPQIIRDHPGKCPLCGMDLVPMPADLAARVNPRQLAVTEDAAALMDIETSPVQRKFVSVEVRMVGKIDYDETLVKNISAWVPGRIDRLYVDFTGITVSKNDHMVDLYSPELISAQAELIQAAKAAAELKDKTPSLFGGSTLATLDAAREKLRLLGLNQEQIQKIEQGGKALTHITIYSPIGGIVIGKNATEGMYVQTGTPIYTVADLSKLWVKLDAYESDLPWICYGQQVEFTTESSPGEVFKGIISFINPVLDPTTRTVKLRVNVENPDGRLKPGMFVRAVVRSAVAQGGKVMAPSMAGKWICPMHPNVIHDGPGKCEVCGMSLVTAESLGYTVEETAKAPLVIPASAPLITGTRAVVYVRVPDVNVPTFEGREVVLGPRAGDYYIVKSGLSEGEIVVTKGNFKIDSDLQIQAKPSMMNPEGEKASPGHSGHQQ